jgi:hypothetical protein
MNKKGVFFTALVIVILSIFLISYTFFSFAQQRKLTEKRIETMNNFLFSVEEDLHRKLFISGFRTIFLFEKHILETGSYLQNVNSSFQEAFYNGTIEGKSTPEIQQLMNGVTFSNITDTINEKAKKINVIVNLSSPSISVIQEDPWRVKITLISNLTMQDLSGLASWNRAQTVIAYIPIEGLEDPFYPLETNYISTTNIITKTPYQGFGSPSNLIDHAENTYYLNNTEAPSFLDRLEGNLTAENINGIESLVLFKLNPIVQGRSIIDHEYFRQIGGQEIGTCLPESYRVDLSNPKNLIYDIC